MNLLSRFPKVSATLTRRAGGTYVSGEWVPGVATPSTVAIINPQPVRENEILPLPEGEHVVNYRKTWAEVPLRVREGDSDADRLTAGGIVYEVFQADDRALDGGFYRVILRKVG